LAICPASFAQHRPGFRWAQESIRKCFRFAGRKQQHGTLFNRPFGGRLRAVKNEIGHSAAFEVRRPLNEELLIRIEAGVKTIRLGQRDIVFLPLASFGGLGHSIDLRILVYVKYPYGVKGLALLLPLLLNH
jgi:hypothetical protein